MPQAGRTSSEQAGPHDRLGNPAGDEPRPRFGPGHQHLRLPWLCVGGGLAIAELTASSVRRTARGNTGLAGPARACQACGMPADKDPAANEESDATDLK